MRFTWSIVQPDPEQASNAGGGRGRGKSKSWRALAMKVTKTLNRCAAKNSSVEAEALAA